MGLMLYIQPSGMPCMVKYHCKAPDRKGFIISTSIKHLLNSTSLYFACFHFPWLCYLRAHSTVIFVQSNMKMPMPTVYCYIFINVFCNSYLIPPLFLLVFYLSPLMSVDCSKAIFVGETHWSSKWERMEIPISFSALSKLQIKGITAVCFL